MTRITLSLACLSLLAQSCSTPSGAARRPLAPSARAPWTAPDLETRVSVRDGREGTRETLDELLAALADSDVVFLGERHDDETTHELELAIFSGLLARRDGRVVLALEMFERDVQPTLDAYLKGEIDERTFLTRVRPWSNYPTAYRRLVEEAKSTRAPVVASNFPRPLLRRGVTATDGKLDLATPEERAIAPRELFANTKAYWRRVDNAIRGHAGMMGAKPDAGDARLTETQSLWDNSMGEACALALDRHPGHAVLHVNGGFHSEYGDGTVRQLRLRKPSARIATVAIVPTANPAAAELDGPPVADHVVFVEDRAHDVDEGTWSVLVPRRARYHLHLPPNATLDARVPLLVWLADDGEDAEDALSSWKRRLGDRCAIAVLEAPYRETGEDLSPGGRWYWPDTFAEDVSAACSAIERMYGYVLRNQPVDPTRVVLAGEGTGATVVASAAILAEDLVVDALALGPRSFTKVKDFPLPLPELRGRDAPALKSLRVTTDAANAAFWKSEVAEYAGVGLPCAHAAGAGDPWLAELERENSVRVALGLGARVVPPDAARAHVVVDGPRARSWARDLALERASRGELVALLATPPSDARSTAIDCSVRAADFASGAPLPRAPGPFGGTTVIVLQDDAPAPESEAWFALQAEDPLAKHSRFHRLVVARASGERSLTVVLGELLEKGRKNVLIAPATWSADGATMRGLRRAARSFEDRMTIHWRPGLGGLQANSPGG